jgi:threonine synthase
MIEVFYDLARAVLYQSDDPLERFYDLLPITDRKSLEHFSLERTPCVHAKNLGRLLNMPWLYLKNETALPTGTVKDRLAAVTVPFLKQSGVRQFCASSTGNTSTSLAHAMKGWTEGRMFLFTAEEFKDRVHFADQDQIVHFVLKNATFVESGALAAEFAARHNLTPEEGFFNPSRREGLKLSFLECCDQIERPIDWYAQAISSAMGVWGTYKGARELKQMGMIDRLPHLLCVQQETCAPMVRAFEDDSPCIRPQHIVEKPHGIASAILRGNPSKAYPYIRGIVLESNGTFTSVSEKEIRDARTMTEQLEGIPACFTSSVAVAGLAKLVQAGRVSRHSTVVINITGSDRDRRKGAKRVHWLYKTEQGWQPDPSDTEAVRRWRMLPD